jgi:hypothetical protein
MNLVALVYGQGKGRKEWIRELYFTEPPDFHIFPRYPLR